MFDCGSRAYVEHLFLARHNVRKSHAKHASTQVSTEASQDTGRQASIGHVGKQAGKQVRIMSHEVENIFKHNEQHLE